MEIWRDIEGYEELYQVSNLGRVRSLNYNRTGKVRNMKLGTYPNGYKMVDLKKDKKRKAHLVHRLVAKAFIPNPNPDQLYEVNHKDEDKTNNAVENLEWCTHMYNQMYGTKRERQAKSKGKPVICITTGETYYCAREAMRKTGVHNSNISKCCNGQCKSAGKHPITGEKLVWKYL